MNSRSKKLSLLKKLLSYVKKHAISERMLDVMEEIRDIDIHVPKTLQLAYTVVGMYCVSLLTEHCVGNKVETYANAMKSVWCRRIRGIEKSDVQRGNSLVDMSMLRRVRDIEDGLLEIDARNKLFKEYKKLNVSKVVHRYVNDAKQNMGLSVSKIRRKNRRWSEIETKTLQIGVELFGEGNWEQILNAYPEIFGDRIGVHLKDKWRNLTTRRLKQKRSPTRRT